MRKPWRRKLRGCSIILLLGDTLNFALCFTSKEFLQIVFDLETGFWDGYQRAAKPNMPSLAQWQADWETRYLSGGAPPKPFCLQGNEKFVAKDNIGALKLYTESVICAPEVGPELSLAFGNRFDFKVLILGIFNPIVWTWSQIWNLSQFCSQVPDLHPFSDMSR